ncbi:MAG: VOC family protein [Desulfomonilaceae bacterium]
MKGQICHIEIPADNLESLRKFYGGVFEWDLEKMSGDIEYYGIKHGDEKPGAGMMARQDPRQTPTFYVCVDSVEESLDRAKSEGATVIVPTTAVKGMGWYAVALDPQKNLFGLWQSDENAA